MDTNDLGEFLKGERKKKDLTLEQLGNLVGVTRSYLSNIENGRRDNPSPEVLKKIADALEINQIEMLQKSGYIKFSGDEMEIIGGMFDGVKTEFHNFDPVAEEREKDKKFNEQYRKLRGIVDADLAYLLKKSAPLYFNGALLSETEKQLLLKIITALLEKES